MSYKVGVLESVSAGYGMDIAKEMPDHFVQEGITMLSSICSSLAMSPSIESVPIFFSRGAERFDFWPSGSILNIFDHASSPQFFEAIAAAQLDGMIVVAPEINGELKQFIYAVRSKIKLWNCSGAFLDLACDKWKLAKYCQQNNIPHPRTALLSKLISPSEWKVFTGQVVIKRRDGAGCMDIAVLNDCDHASQFAKLNGLLDYADNWIVQDWIGGQHASRSMVSDGMGFKAMPIVSQTIVIESFNSAFDERLPHYHGAGPLNGVDQSLGLDILNLFHSEFKEQCLGWVGADLVIPDDPNDKTSCYLIEINPRFTTSFDYLQRMQSESILAEPILRFLTPNSR